MNWYSFDMSDISIEEFFERSKHLAKYARWTYGSAILNNLYLIKPSMAKILRDAAPDFIKLEGPEGSAFNENLWNATITFIEGNWNNE